MDKKPNKKNVKLNNAIRNVLLNEEFIFKSKFINDYMKEFSDKTNNDIQNINNNINLTDSEIDNTIHNLKNGIILMKKYLNSEFIITDFKDGIIYFKNPDNIQNHLTMNEFFEQTINKIDIDKLSKIILKINPEVEIIYPILQNIADNIVENKINI